MEVALLNRTTRILSGHLWVFSNELARSPKSFTPASLVELRDRKNNFLGIGYVNPHSLIAIRILTTKAEEIDKEFFKKRITNALEYRKKVIKGRDAFRAVYSESDLLPGLIVDKFGDCLSVQLLTLGMDSMSDMIIEALDEVFSPRAIVLRNDSPSRALEGLKPEKRLVKGSLDTPPQIREGDTVIEVDMLAGQKTGFFLDQAENRGLFGSLTGAGAGLDLFCYTGAWSIKMAGAGAATTGVDSSEAAIAQARRNAELNNLSSRCSFIKADVFGFAKDGLAKKSVYDYIVLDPPAFVKSKANLKEGLRAYREMNSICMRLLKRGGLLATSSCSFHVDRNTFIETLRASAKDAGRGARVIEVRSQAKDHPISLQVPETEYLKCVIMEVD
ncbi:MAG: class I SAM-dependent rRNA methyltransferase [Deltaproteobacteria bacterium]|nr:class I SAM-dependent rRNA methyltransferase [Deltaproteobacteria bacterium]